MPTHYELMRFNTPIHTPSLRFAGLSGALLKTIIHPSVKSSLANSRQCSPNPNPKPNSSPQPEPEQDQDQDPNPHVRRMRWQCALAFTFCGIMAESQAGKLTNKIMKT